MIFSKACEYGIRSVLYIARLDSGQYLPIQTIGDDLGISHHFLTKVLQDLTKVGILKSSRGPKGGVALAENPSGITLYDVVVAIEGRTHFDECVLGLPSCDDSNPCPLHKYWAETRDAIKQKFRNVKVLHLSDRILTEGLRLSVHDASSDTNLTYERDFSFK